MPIDHKTIYAHWFKDLPYKSVAAICQKVKQASADEFAIKVGNGASLMANVGLDSGLSPHSFGELSDLYGAFAQEGIILLPYCVALGESWKADADLAINVGKACGGVVETDLEPYSYFWTVNRADIDDYAKRIVDAGVSLYANLDLRPAGTNPFPDPEERALYAVCSRVLGQCYYDYFDKNRVKAGLAPYGVTNFPNKDNGYANATGWIDRELVYLRDMGVDPQKRGMIVEAGGEAWKHYGDAAIALEQRDAKTLGLWHLGNASDVELWAFAAVGGGGTITVEKVVEKIVEVPVPTYPDEAAMRAILGRLAGNIDELRELTGVKD